MSKPSSLLPETSSADWPAPTVSPESSCDTATLGRKRASRFRWGALIIPAALVLIVLTTRYIPHSVSLDSSSGLRRVVRGVSNVPTIPQPPVVTLNPLPASFDASNPRTLTTDCANFLYSLVASQDFRACVPFGLLIQYSTQFAKAESDLSLLNTLTSLTCNPTPDFEVCGAEMQFYVATLETVCAKDLGQSRTNVNGTLRGMALYREWYGAACIPNDVTGAYCYIEAMASSNPADQYMYYLLSGLEIPSDSKPTCSLCLNSLWSAYIAALSSMQDNLNIYAQVSPAIIHAYYNVLVPTCGYHNDSTPPSAGVGNAIKESGSSGLAPSPSSSWFTLVIVCVLVVIF